MILCLLNAVRNRYGSGSWLRMRRASNGQSLVAITPRSKRYAPRGR